MIRAATILAVGKLKNWPDEACEDYLKRLRRHGRVEVIEVPEADMNRLSHGEVLAAEAERLEKRIPSGARTIALDRESGKHISSEKFAGKLEALGVSGQSHVAFIIGGAIGLDEGILSRADEAISFGDITLPHALARVVLLEQLYRAAKISRGEKYHW
ncbi:MAG: 23S rRNA (pseudouridine(1915)-N(3))-methyltransferase RlmH [Rubrobacter sp.]|nr:23S rRNA (pseudouridine(1915)-N(3))-methyltransferase RlmH [Rubrobacter sp.]